MGLYDDIIGSVLIGSWVNAMLFSYEATEMYKYFSRYPKDSTALKVVVGFLLFVDFMEVLATFAWIYMVTVTHWGEPLFLLRHHWASPTYVVLNAFNCLIVQNFLIYRYWTLTKRWYVALGLVLLSFTAVGAEFASGAGVAMHPVYTELAAIVLPVTIWLVAAAVADLCIATALVIELKSMRLSYKKTQKIVTKLIHRAISTGSITALMAVAIAASFLINRESNVPNALNFFFGRLYTISMMFNLNNRRWAGQSGEPSSSNGLPGIHNVGDPSSHNMRTFSLNGIHVHSTAVVHTDGDRGSNSENYVDQNAKDAKLRDDSVY